MPERPDDDTLRLLHEVLAEIGTNEAISEGGTLFQMQISWHAGGALEATFGEPPLRVLRHLLDLLRHVDMPSSDIRLERVYPILDRMELPDGWRGELAKAKAAYAAGQEVSDIRVQQPDQGPVADEASRTWIKPREAFGLWAYGGVIHHDYAKEQKWARLEIAQGPVRQMGHDYAMMLIEQADFLFRLLNAIEERAAEG